MDTGGVDAYRDALLEHAEVVTPNLREAAMLCGVDVNDVKNHDDMLALAHQLLGFGSTWVLVKGAISRSARSPSAAPPTSWSVRVKSLSLTLSA